MDAAIIVLVFPALFGVAVPEELELKGVWGSVYSGQFCDYENFISECSRGEGIQILSAVYGHMEVGKCIKADIGYLGCKADVSSILKILCNGNQRCEIDVSDSKFREIEPCTPGIDLYLEVKYACLKERTEHEVCNDLRAKPTVQYISGYQITSSRCLNEGRPLRIVAESGQHIALSSIQLSEQESSSYAVAVNEETQEQISILPSNVADGMIRLQTHAVSILPNQDFDPPAYILGFKATGCQNIDGGRGTSVARNGNEVVISCIHSEQQWKLRCRGVHWLGIVGNCTKSSATFPPTNKPQINEPKEDNVLIEKDVIYLIVICVTVFLSVLVITTGYVCLRTARIENGLDIPKKKPAEAEWAFGANQTMTLLAKQRPDSDYLQPMSANEEDQLQLQHNVLQAAAIYDTPPPNPIRVHGDNTSVKRNNDEDYNATVSSTSTDYKKYFVLDKDYMNTKECMNNV